jgi:hypothetical protein
MFYAVNETNIFNYELKYLKDQVFKIHPNFSVKVEYISNCEMIMIKSSQIKT